MIEKIKISQVVIVEGKYDKIKLASLIDGLIIELNGFRIYKDKEKAALIKAIAKKQGAIILTDPDRAGFQLRGYLKNILGDIDKNMITEIYIPQIIGKEKRKETASKEGYLGVEGTNADTLRQLLAKASNGHHLDKALENAITPADFYADGLSGGDNSSKKRLLMLSYLSLPGYVSSKGLLDVINSLVTREEYELLIKKINSTMTSDEQT